MHWTCFVVSPKSLRLTQDSLLLMIRQIVVNVKPQA